MSFATGAPAVRRSTPRFDRRRFLAMIGAGGLFFTQRGAFADALVLTPAQTQGPYYPDHLPLDQDNDLLLINDAITPALGTPAWVSGRVLDRNGAPVRNAVIEIWQADNYGSYIHSQGVQRGSQRDGNFQGYGRFITSSTGEYLFRSIKPGLYTGRSRHVHYKITLPGGDVLITQLYIEGETGNDSVLSGIRDAAQRVSVIRPWMAIEGSPVGALAVTFDVVMGYTPVENAVPERPVLVAVGGVVNAANSNPGAAAGGWITLYGQGLTEDAGVQIAAQPSTVKYVNSTRVDALAPDGPADTDVQVTVANGAGSSDPATVTLQRFMPAFFEYAGQYAAAVRADETTVAPAGLIEGVDSTPARPGETVRLTGTGFGPSDGTPAVRVRIDNQDVAVASVQLASPGVWQVEITVPDLPDGDYPVVAEVGGVRTVKMVKLRIERAQG